MAAEGYYPLVGVVAPVIGDYSISLIPGWNLIALEASPVDATDQPITLGAESFGQAVGAQVVTRWDNASQQYNSHVVGIPLNDFALVPGSGYFVNVAAPATYVYRGIK